MSASWAKRKGADGQTPLDAVENAE